MNKKDIYQELIKINEDYLNQQISQDYDIKYIKDITNHINKDKLIIVSWIRNIWKSNLIWNIILKTNILDKSLYFNKDLDSENLIRDLDSLNNLIKEKKNLRYIFLQNIGNIEWIKTFISKLYKQNYKIVIIWNDIKIPNITDINICKQININDIKNTLLFWFMYNWTNTKNIKTSISLIIDNIILKWIVQLKSVKNVILYKSTLTFLSKLEAYKSIRDIHRNISEQHEISLKTFMDYIDFSIQENIIEKIPLFDIKKNKEITSKSKYFFTDNWIRNTLTNYTLDNQILKENLIFIKLKYNNFKIYWGLNWLFSFSFIAEKENKKIYIHLSESTEKTDIKKEVNKLLKIWDNNKKYLIINDLEKLNLRKKEYDSVSILTFNEIIKKDL